jgi:uncharacterized protein (UPF0248 family)
MTIKSTVGKVVAVGPPLIQTVQAVPMQYTPVVQAHAAPIHFKDVQVVQVHARQIIASQRMSTQLQWRTALCIAGDCVHECFKLERARVRRDWFGACIYTHARHGRTQVVKEVPVDRVVEVIVEKMIYNEVEVPVERIVTKEILVEIERQVPVDRVVEVRQ